MFKFKIYQTEYDKDYVPYEKDFIQQACYILIGYVLGFVLFGLWTTYSKVHKAELEAKKPIQVFCSTNTGNSSNDGTNDFFQIEFAKSVETPIWE